MSQNELERICGMWLKDGKSGKYMSGRSGDERLLIFKNDRKKNERDPDYVLYRAPADGDSTPAAGSKPAHHRRPVHDPAMNASFAPDAPGTSANDEIPF